MRRIPNKLGGVLALFLSLLILLILPIIYNCRMKGRAFYPIAGVMFWGLVVVFLLMTAMGIAPVEAPFTSVGLVCTLVYFLFFCTLSVTSSQLGKLIY